MPTRRTLAAAALALTAALSLGACSSSGSAGAAASSAKAAGHSALANPTISNDLNVEEQLLLNNLQHNFDPAHPFKSVDTAVKLTFPKGDTSKIEKYAVSIFTLSVLHTKGPGSARDIWLMKVVAYAQSSQGAGPTVTPAPASTATGQASIPGVSP